MRALLAAVVLAGCVSQEVQPPDREWELTGEALDVLTPPPPPPEDAPADDGLLDLLTPAGPDPDYLDEQPPSPFHRLGRSVIRGLDGSWSKSYALRTGRGDSVVALLQSSVPGFPVEPGVAEPPDVPAWESIRWVLHRDFYVDESETFGQRTQVWPARAGTVGDVLIVTAPPETLVFIDELLFRLLADVPQIELEVRVVEVNLDDLLDYDVQALFKNLTDPLLPFDPVTNPIKGKFGAGIPITDEFGSATGAGLGFSSFLTTPTLSGFLLSLQGVHDNLQVDVLLSLLQTVGAAELISSPTVTVLNGHRAILTTGDRVPVFEATGVGSDSQVTTRYEETGVSVEMIPFIVSEDVIRVDLSVDVSTVTGEVPFNLLGTEVATPIISQRDTGTTVHVHSGQTFSVGGLKASSIVETISKVPFLGDIPILGWLFKSRASRTTNTEIVFFITPRIRIPSEALLRP